MLTAVQVFLAVAFDFRALLWFNQSWRKWNFCKLQLKKYSIIKFAPLNAGIFPFYAILYRQFEAMHNTIFKAVAIFIHFSYSYAADIKRFTLVY